MHRFPLQNKFQLVAGFFVCLWTVSVAGQVIEEVHAFEWPQGNPSGGLVEASDGSFYGVTNEGGPGGEGTIFRVTPSGVLTMVVAFDGSNGGRPHPELVEGDDGHLYGTGSTIFRLKLNGDLTSIASASATNELNPAAGLIKGRGGQFYGTDFSSGSNRMGTVFSVSTNGLVTTLAEFSGTNGAYPECSLAEGEDGSLYGTTTYGGEHQLGTVFRVSPSGSIETLMSFDSTNGYEPTSGLTEATDGNIYGMTSRGSIYDLGTIFRIAPSGECAYIAVFNREVGAPRGRLIQATDGNFYGVADSVFRFNKTAGIEPFSFTFNQPVYPKGTLLQGGDGFLYGAGDGTNGRGGIFRMDLDRNYVTLASFPEAPTGYRPQAGLVTGRNGHLYGTTLYGLRNDQGTLFDFDPIARSLTTIPADGLWHPKGTLLLAEDGSLFGTSSSVPEVFRVTPDRVVTGFASLAEAWLDAGRPEGSLAQDNDGNVYGVTYWRGDYNLGTIFKILPSGEITTIHSFNGEEGAHPSAGLTLAKDGYLYGTTERGGPSGENGPGTVFKISPSGNFTLLGSFSRTNGAQPEAELIQGSDGNFYGTTLDGGAYDRGTIFRVTPSGVLTSLFSFNYTNGASPMAPLVEVGGVLYGTTRSGGEFYRGGVFGVSLSGELKSLAFFNRRNGVSPRTGLTRGVDGHLYGTTPQGGSLGGGNIYRLMLPVKPQLRVAESEEGITLMWLKGFSDYRLEAKIDFNLARPWRQIEGTRTTNADYISITLEAGPDKQFFRLVKP